jgi:hypothetical protein
MMRSHPYNHIKLYSSSKDYTSKYCHIGGLGFQQMKGRAQTFVHNSSDGGILNAGGIPAKLIISSGASTSGLQTTTGHGS